MNRGDGSRSLGRPVGIEIFYFMDRWSDDQASKFSLARECGYDGVEISLMSDAIDDYEKTRIELAKSELGVACSTGLTEATDVSSADPAVRRSGIEYLKRCLEISATLGSDILGGVTYAPWFAFPEDQDLGAFRERSAESLREVAVAADSVGVALCVELLNRFETYMLNTVEQAVSFLELIGHSSVMIELDTFHMNMEEADLATAIRLAGDRLGHFQCAASNRALPGAGHIDWQAISGALDDVGYTGWLILETFPNPLVETGRSTHAWRPLVEDLIPGAARAAEFLRNELGGRPLFEPST